MARHTTPPALVHHKPRNQGRVRIDGRDIYLGPWGSTECLAAYDNVLRQWRLAQADPHNLTVDVLAIRYVEHADTYYRRADGTPTKGADAVRDAVKPIVGAIGRKLVRDVTPIDLVAVRSQMIAQQLARTTINGRVDKIKACFKWAVSVGYCPVEVWQGLTSVSGLKAGRSAARETEPVRPVSVAVVEATIPHLTWPVQGIVRFQMLTGCRPTEACTVRPCDLDMQGDTWLYRPLHHKVEHLGRDRVIAVGPRAQSVVLEYLTTDTNAYLFSPRLVTRNGGLHYKRQGYLNAVKRACDNSNLPRWCPLQLRHTHGTEVRQRFGLEAAQVVLGHARADVTQIYAERDLAKAREVAAAMG
jgi:integrase